MDESREGAERRIGEEEGWTRGREEERIRGGGEVWRRAKEERRGGEKRRRGREEEIKRGVEE